MTPPHHQLSFRTPQEVCKCSYVLTETDVLQPTLSALATMRWKVSSLCESLANSKNSKACCFKSNPEIKSSHLFVSALPASIHPHWMCLLMLFCACCFSSSVHRCLIHLTQLLSFELRRSFYVCRLSCRSHGRFHSGWRERRARRLHPGSAAVCAARRSLRLRHAVSSASARISSLISGTLTLKSCLWLTALTSSQCSALAFSSRKTERCWPDFSFSCLLDWLLLLRRLPRQADAHLFLFPYLSASDLGVI